jgi:hypothetical protein
MLLIEKNTNILIYLFRIYPQKSKKYYPLKLKPFLFFQTKKNRTIYIFFLDMIFNKVCEFNKAKKYNGYICRKIIVF